MKRILFGQNKFIYAALLFCLFTACRKEKLQPFDSQPNGTVNSNRPKAIARSNNLVLQTFTRYQQGNISRQYSFFYAPNGKLDSIAAVGGISYVYRVVYKGSHMDSISLIENNRLVSTVRDFDYKGNLITSFNYFARINNQPFPFVYSVTYDNQKRITSIERTYQNVFQGSSEFIYDGNNDVERMNGATYMHDDELNPLYTVPDLFAIMFEEHWIWEFAFSLHNSVSKTPSTGQVVYYQNQYNMSNQLVLKNFYDVNQNGNNSFSFTYQ
jgi:hypothetical protein